MSKTTVAKHVNLSDFPDVATAEAKATKLLGLFREREAELQAANLQKPGNVDAEAKRLFDGETVGDSPDIVGLRHSVQVAKTASAMAEGAWQQARIRAGAELCRENQAEYLEIVERVENAFVELLDSLKTENDFFHSFLRRGVQQPSFNRPFLQNHPALLRQFLSVTADEFRV